MNEEDEVDDYSDWQLPISFINKRYIENIEGANTLTQTWRMKERMKTVSVALVLCLNVGVDPPDIVKTQPCARLECWIDPLSMSPQKALETIGGNLQKQYERWQPRARYKQSLDPTVEEVKKLCTSLRRNAKEERVLFHYNGHGVPKPTANGEVWVFNRTYTQYIPLSVYDLQTWMGAPSIYVYDCSNAGIIVDSFKQFAEQHETEFQKQNRTSQSPPPSFKNCIQLAACSANQILPMNPDLPADIFTSCLTTPIKIALRWFVMQNSSLMAPKITLDLIDKIPGQLNDRRTMLGELNWIFTAITDTIAWNTLPRDVFQKLFRQDLLVASLFRNFLLAERIMRSYDCTPVSWPPLPPTYQHAMWQAWDLALDLCLAQLPGILEREEPFVHSPFFEEQLTAFQVWLSLGSEQRSPPEQLPIVLQVLLSQVHRLRALELLGRFLDLGPWAVNLALSVGIFPYVLKLLQSNAKELRPLLVFIWAKILAVDSTCQADLVRDNGHKYFLSVLNESNLPSEHRTLSAFVLASIVNGYPQGQEAALKGSLVSICLDQLWDKHALLRQWLAITLARLWTNFSTARWTGVRDSAHEKLFDLLSDQVPEVRASAVYALGTFVASVTKRSEHANNIDHSLAMTLINSVVLDMSPLVRRELVAALQWMVLIFESAFVTVLIQEESGARCAASELTHSPGMKRISSRDRLKSLAPGYGQSSDFTGSSASIKRVSSSSSISSLAGSNNIVPSLTYGSIYTRLWNGLNLLDQDPHPSVRSMARVVTKHVRDQMKHQTSPINLFHTSSSSGTGLGSNQSGGHHHHHATTSVSLPPSPSTRPTFLSGESPPSTINTASSNELLRLTASMPPVQGHSNQQSPGNFMNTSLGRSSRPRKIMPNTITEEMGVISTATVNTGGGGEAGNVTLPEPLVTTQFVPWSSRYFAQPVMKCSEEQDMESHLHFDREWRYQRNRSLRLEAADELRRGQSLGSLVRLDNCIYSYRAANQPSVLLFHPYDPHLLVGIKDSFGLMEWCTSGISSNHSMPGSPSVISSSASISTNSTTQSGKLHLSANRGMLGTRITAMQIANAHDVSLLFTGSDDGSVRLWSNYSLTLAREPNLVTAWQALSEMRSGNSSGHFSSSQSSSPSLVMSWNQRAQLLLVTGDVRFVRLWDATTELKLSDIPTGAESCVTSLSCSESEKALMCVGCGDGSVRLLDRRHSPQDARIGTWREHRSWVVDVHLDESANRIISGSVAGDIRVYDTRQSHTPLESHKTSQGMTAMAVHSQADLFACGFVNQYIGVFSKSTGQALHTIKHQGFMSPRVGPVSCLAFHPHRLCLAAGSVDTTISVYGLGR